MRLEKDRALPIIKAALKEDIGRGDITTQALIDETVSAEATIVTREDCVICGLEIAEWAMAQIDYSVRFRPNCSDGASVGAGKELAFIEGHAASMLRAERTMLNFLSLLSGIATRTRLFVEKARPYGVRVMDTRKTLPLLRYLEKYSVHVGGGANHRMGLYDRVLIKDNHISVVRKNEPASLKDMVEKARRKSQKGTTVEIEVTSLEEFSDAIAGNPDIIMLDNMDPARIRTCVEIRRLAVKKPLIEASGGITLNNIEDYAKTKVDMISVGSLTSAVKPIDMSLEIV